MRQELVLLSKLFLLLEKDSEQQVREGLVQLLPWVKRFVDRGLNQTSRSPEDFVPYQQLLWKYQSANSDLPEPHSECTKGDLLKLIQEMKFCFHSRLWHNTFNDMSFLSPLSPNQTETTAEVSPFPN